MVIRGQMMILMMPFQREKLLGMAELLFPTPGEEKEEKEEEEKFLRTSGIVDQAKGTRGLRVPTNTKESVALEKKLYYV